MAWKSWKLEWWAIAKTSSGTENEQEKSKTGEKKEKAKGSHEHSTKWEKRGETESSWNRIFMGEKIQVGATMWQICSTGHPWKNQEGHPQKIFLIYHAFPIFMEIQRTQQMR